MTLPFVLGANYPWVTCGHDFGPRPPAWSGAAPTDWDRVRRDFDELAALGLSVVRFWILGGGVNYPVGADPRTVADRVPFRDPYRSRAAWARGRAFHYVPRTEPPGLPQGFLDDFARLLDACRRAGVRLIPSLLSFELFLPINEQSGGPESGGRGAFVLRENTRPFFDRVLEPLLDVCEGHRDALFAFEVMNEPDWPVLPSPSRGPFVSPLVLCDFLLEGARRIARRELVATIGFTNARPSWLPPSVRVGLSRLAERGAYVHQRHAYPREDLGVRLAPASESAVTPCLIGELPSAQARRWADPELWDTESDPDRYLEARLRLARERGYIGALVWACNSMDTQTRWNDRTRAQLRRVAQRV